MAMFSSRAFVRVQKSYNCTFDWILSSRPEVLVFSALSLKPFGFALCMAAVPHVQLFVCKQTGVCWVWFVPRGSWHANTGVPVVTHRVPRCFGLLVTISVKTLPITKEIFGEHGITSCISLQVIVLKLYYFYEEFISILLTTFTFRGGV